MIEKVKADKILASISPFLKLYHPNMDKPAEENLFYFTYSKTLSIKI
jgi:hypothetical protein